jgi:biopolymer transport protein ExbD
MRKKKKKPQTTFPAMAPLIDVVFLLIIFFVVTLKLETVRNKQIMPPSTVHAPELKDPALTIQVDKDGRMFLFGSECTLHQLRRALMSRHPGSAPIRVEADAQAKHTHVRTVIDECAAAGHAQINLIGRKAR